MKIYSKYGLFIRSDIMVKAICVDIGGTAIKFGMLEYNTRIL